MFILIHSDLTLIIFFTPIEMKIQLSISKRQHYNSSSLCIHKQQITKI